MNINKLFCLTIAVFLLFLTHISIAKAGDGVEKFQAIFCQLDPGKQSHPVIPADVYQASVGQKITCGDLTYMVRVKYDTSDPGHNVYNVDPPSGVKKALDCDGKADTGMFNIALNCMPVSEEMEEHVKP